MKKYKFFIAILTFSILHSISVKAQEERNKGIIWSSLRGLEYEVKAGFSIGGTSPLPLPKEIRSIDSYNPNMAIAIEGNATKWFGSDKKWGMLLGLRLENKSMTTKATVKNYNMEIIGDGGEKVSGVWTGGVKTKVKNSYLTIPILAKYKLTKRWNLTVGPYFSYMLEGDFLVMYMKVIYVKQIQRDLKWNSQMVKSQLTISPMTFVNFNGVCN